MGLLRKLAAFVIELPDQDKPAAAESIKAVGASGADVAAAIEQIRLSLDQSAAEAGVRADAPLATTPHQQSAGPQTGELAQAQGGTEFVSVERVYELAGLSSSGSAVDLERIARLVEDEELARLDPQARASALNVALKAIGVELAELLAIAGRRDLALDSYEARLEKHVEQLAGECASEQRRLEQELEEFTRRQQGLISKARDKEQEVRRKLGEFKSAKQAEERRLFELMAQFVAPGDNPVKLEPRMEYDESRDDSQLSKQ